jgi:hypothetical protein
MSRDIEKLLKELRAYRDDMVARNYPFQRISDIITRWEMDKVEVKRDFLEEAEREKKELEESYQESRRQTEERKQREWLKGYNKWKKTQDV